MRANRESIYCEGEKNKFGEEVEQGMDKSAFFLRGSVRWEISATKRIEN